MTISFFVNPEYPVANDQDANLPVITHFALVEGNTFLAGINSNNGRGMGVSVIGSQVFSGEPNFLNRHVICKASNLQRGQTVPFQLQQLNFQSSIPNKPREEIQLGVVFIRATNPDQPVMVNLRAPHGQEGYLKLRDLIGKTLMLNPNGAVLGEQ